MPLRPSHLVVDHLFESPVAVWRVASACGLCCADIPPRFPEFKLGSAPMAQAAREHRWRHIECLLLLRPGVSGRRNPMMIALLHDDLFRVCARSAPANAALSAAFPYAHVPIMAATAPRLASFHLYPAATLGRHPPCHMQLRCFSLGLVAAFLRSVSCAVCTRQAPICLCVAKPSPALLARRESWLLCMWPGCVLTPRLLTVPDPVLHLSAPVHRGAWVDARLRL